MVLICSDCVQIHRSLGRQVSQVKSLSDSSWDQTPILMDLIHELYSQGSNSVWEHTLVDATLSTPRKQLSKDKDSSHSGRQVIPKKKPQPKDPLYPVKEDFIRAKYSFLSYINRSLWRESLEVTTDTSLGVESPSIPSLGSSSSGASTTGSNSGGGGQVTPQDDLSQQLHSAVRTPNLKVSLRLLASGAAVNYIHREKGGTTPLHVACNSNQILQVELLLTFGADPLIRDSSGKQAIDVAQQNGFKDIYDRLLAAPYLVTDRLYFFVSGKRVNHESGQHILFPIEKQASPSIIGVTNNRQNSLESLSNRVFEELVKDVFDEVDRRETNQSMCSVKAMTLVPFLPVNASFSSMRNQGRQKLATLIRHEFNCLIIDILKEASLRMTEPVLGDDGQMIHSTHDNSHDYESMKFTTII